MEIILQGVVGSIAYGLATPNSDIDRLGIFVATTDSILSLNKPNDSFVKTTPDITLHEIEKYMRLAINCNPTVLELLFLDKYEIITQEGQLLLNDRRLFLSNTVFNSYGGYAIAQAKKLQKRATEDSQLDTLLKDVDRGFSAKTSSRAVKHAKHCFRLLQQGKELLETGELCVKVNNPENFSSFGDMTIKEVLNKFENKYSEFKNSKNTLPDNCEYDKINKLLLKIRKNH